MHRENDESVARDVAEYSLDCSDGGNVRELVGENECAYEARDAEEGTGDEYRE